MRHLLCHKCLRRHLPAGERLARKASKSGPAEFQRVVLGTAKQPQQDQRWQSVNGDVTLLPVSHFNCDSCDAEIEPGQVCSGWSVWREDMLSVPEWESEYLVPITQQEFEKWEAVNGRLQGGDRKKREGN